MDCAGGKSGGGSGPCGACKFLRRKCVRGCIFAPYFDSDHGAAYFAAVHKVFGASNASKLLSRIPPHQRLDAVLTLCYEALARAHDPVYGCVAHLFALQHQVVNLQAELAYVQARLSTLQNIPVAPTFPPQTSSSPTTLSFCSDTHISIMHFDPFQPLPASLELSTFLNSSDDQQLDDNGAGDLQDSAQEFVSRYLAGGARFEPSNPR